MLVSVIIPIYNTAPYLRECLESVLGQSYKNLDLVLVDDGSMDSSLEIALEFAKRDSRVFVVSKANGGQSSARNLGLEFVKGTALRTWVECGGCGEIFSCGESHSFEKQERKVSQQELEQHFCIHTPYFVKTDLIDSRSLVLQDLPHHFVHFLDSDDYLLPDSLSQLVQKAEQEELDICAYNLKRYFEQEKRMEVEHNFDIPNHLKSYAYEKAIDAVVESGEYSFVFTWQGIFRASLLNAYNLRFTQGIYGEDNDFGVILFALSGRFAYLDYAGIVYRIHANSSTSKISDEIPAHLPSYLEVLRGEFEDYRALRLYFHTYCVCLAGLQIEKFFREALRVGKLSNSYESFFNHCLAWHLDLCRVSLRKDPLNIRGLIEGSGVKMSVLLWHTWRQILRHPKKLKNFYNIFYLFNSPQTHNPQSPQ